MRRLLVEDHLRLSVFIKNELRENGFAVDLAENGEDGLYLASTESYDTAIIDILPPKLDGLPVNL